MTRRLKGLLRPCGCQQLVKRAASFGVGRVGVRCSRVSLGGLLWVFFFVFGSQPRFHFLVGKLWQELFGWVEGFSPGLDQSITLQKFEFRFLTSLNLCETRYLEGASLEGQAKCSNEGNVRVQCKSVNRFFAGPRLTRGNRVDWHFFDHKCQHC